MERSWPVQPSPSPETFEISAAATAGTARVKASAGAAPADTRPHAVDPAEAESVPWPERYEPLSTLGEGAMGTVLRVHDRELSRQAAMKMLREGLESSPGVRAAFVDEARLAAQLQHPGIVAIYDRGVLPDGRPYFTMSEIRGRTLADEINRHAKEGVEAEVALRRLVPLMVRVCDAVAYAHGRGVVHRDLKPSNIMLGEHGEVYVVDWGIGKVVDAESQIFTVRSTTGLATQAGSVVGTPAFMAPELVSGHAAGTSTDVYALGATLYTVLAARHPYRAFSAQGVIERVLEGPPPDVRGAGPWRVPDELAEICERAMARDPAARFGSAAELGAALGSWLEGSKRRARALELVGVAERLLAEAVRLRERAAAARANARAALGDVPKWAPEAGRHVGWSLEEEAAEHDRGATLREHGAEQRLQAALTHGDSTEAHRMLAAYYRREHERAEAAGDDATRMRAEVFLTAHASALSGAERRAHLDYVRGDGALSVATEPPCERIELLRFREEHRRLVARHERSLGSAPVDTALAMGSYLVELHARGREPTRWPALVERCGRWPRGRPGGEPSRPVPLPPAGSLQPDDVYVPEGWFLAGDPPRWMWAEGFLIKRFPVTNRQFIQFLDALVDEGREQEALAYAPRERPGGATDTGAIVYGQSVHGRFELRPDADGDLWDPEWPVIMVDYAGALAYADWVASRTGEAWRLPYELEWEKAARGVDGREYPWGDFIDTSWACCADGQRERPLPSVVTGYPVDESPYGVRGMGGNCCDWCVAQSPEDYPEGSAVQAGPAVATARDVEGEQTPRGGGFLGDPAGFTTHRRRPVRARYRNVGTGFRLARSFDP